MLYHEADWKNVNLFFDSSTVLNKKSTNRSISFDQLDWRIIPNMQLLSHNKHIVWNNHYFPKLWHISFVKTEKLQIDKVEDKDSNKMTTIEHENIFICGIIFISLMAKR